MGLKILCAIFRQTTHIPRRTIRCTYFTSFIGFKINSLLSSNLSTYCFRAYSPDVVVDRAMAQIGKTDYDLFTNNCEHFVNYCKYGYPSSSLVVKTMVNIERINKFISNIVVY